ncbi:NAD(P)-binding protein [Amycolatopsis sp. cg5]|uniref:NAD(P)/FAD-dependent oxidoreductase n=1 Tax=Amycolatopsis sp. cg5 TaxID=3238802 RepID=UPI0035265D84
MDFSAPVCVVGGGQSGILVAAKLRELGYRDIDILEAGARLGGYSETVTVDGQVYDFQAHLIGQQDFGPDMAGTAVEELTSRHPVELQSEALYFVSRSDSGKPMVAVPPHFVPLLRTLTPIQAVDQLADAWTIIEQAVRERRGPGLGGLAFDGTAETWETYRARHAPLVGEILQGIALYANMRRPRQPAATVININAHISGHVSQLAKLLLAVFPADRQAMLDRMPPSLRAQIDSRRPIARSFPSGFISFLRRIVDDHGLTVTTGARVTRVDGRRVTWQSAGVEHSKTYESVIVTARPSQLREFLDGDLFSEKNCPRTWTRSYLVRVHEELIEFPKDRLGFWVIDPYGSYTDTDPEQALHRVTAVNKQHAGPYWVCFSNSDLSVSDEQAWALAKESLFLFRDPELVAETIAEWPAYPSAAALRDGWFDEVTAAQGRDGVYFVGEILSGPTLECISEFVRTVIPEWFAR